MSWGPLGTAWGQKWAQEGAKVIFLRQNEGPRAPKRGQMGSKMRQKLINKWVCVLVRFWRSLLKDFDLKMGKILVTFSEFSGKNEKRVNM